MRAQRNVSVVQMEWWKARGHPMENSVEEFIFHLWHSKHAKREDDMHLKVRSMQRMCDIVEYTAAHLLSNCVYAGFIGSWARASTHTNSILNIVLEISMGALEKLVEVGFDPFLIRFRWC